ncbi:MAG: hypothetical protein GX783_13310 [Clostridiales bacterium]|nr:hypothetical protein [Clostridiales bacterium]
MKKRLTSILLCILLISLQIFTTGNVVHAEEELVITTEVGGRVTEINGQTFVSALDFYLINYSIKNTSRNEIIINQIVEKGAGNKEYTHNIEKSLKPDDSPLTQAGGQFLGDMELTPNSVEYVIKYTVLSEDGDRTKDKVLEVKGKPEYIHVAEVEFNVDYTADTNGPIFKGDQLTLQADILSISNVPLHNLKVTDKDLGLELGTIDVLSPGKKATLQRTIAMEKATSGTLVITYDDPIGYDTSLDKTISTELKIEIKDEEPVSSLNVSGKTSMNKIPGETPVDFELLIKNTGNTSLTELKLMDWDAKEFHTHAALLPGEEITVEYKAKLEPDKNYELLVQARVENSNQLIKSTWSTKLEKLEPKVEIQRSISTDEIESGVPFTLEYVLKNTGNVDLTNIKINESHFGEIKIIELLEAGQEVEFEKEVELEEKTSSKTILTAFDAETNKEYSYESSDMEFEVTGLAEELPSQALSIILKSDVETLSKPGNVNLEAIVKNTGQEPLSSLVLTLMERDMVIVNNLTLQAGEEKTIPAPALRVEETETFVVEANGLGADQQKFTVKSQPLTITFSESGLSGQFNVLRLILIVIILLSIFVIGVLVYTLSGSPKFPFKRKKKVNRLAK